MKSLIMCGENFINANNTYAVSSGTGAAYLYDQKPLTQYVSSGSTDGYSETVEITFNDTSGVALSRTIDRLIFLNCNLAQFYADYWDGAAWQTIAESVFTTNTSANVYVEIATPIATTKLRITATHTIVAGQEKKIGEFKACLFMLLVRHLVSISRKDWNNGQKMRLQGGGLISYNDLSKFEADVIIDSMSLANYEIIISALRTRLWTTWILWSDFRLADVYEVKATSAVKEQLNRKTYRYTISFQASER